MGEKISDDMEILCDCCKITEDKFENMFVSPGGWIVCGWCRVSRSTFRPTGPCDYDRYEFVDDGNAIRAIDKEPPILKMI